MTNNARSESDFLPSIESLRVEWNTQGEDIQWETAITLGEMSALAYTEPHNRELVARQIGFDKVEILEEGSMSGFFVMTDDVAVVAFRGTDMFSPEDWLANADFRDRLPLNSDHEVHRGFQNAYGCFADEIKTHLSERKPEHTWITGHSLGGAMAECCAYDLVVSRLALSGLVTFGQPRIGNKEMARFIDDEIGHKYMRFINEHDPVPCLPPGIGLTKYLPDYRHSGARVRFKDGELERTSGVVMFSATGPTTGATSESASPTVPDEAENTITEDGFLALQKQLRAERGNSEPSSEPEPARYGAEPTQPVVGAMPDFGDMAKRIFESFRERIGDHSMDEYRRQLNEFRQHS